MNSTNALTTPPAITNGDLADLMRRVRDTGRADDPWRDDPSRGFGPDALAPLLEHWSGDYDWRAHERRILALPWQVVGSDERALRLVHQPAAVSGAPTVVLLHGWPDSVLRFERVLPLLRDVNVVVPAMPGFPFSLRRSGACSVQDIAGLVVDAVAELGYDRFVLSGGGVGGDIAEIIAGTHPERVAAMHLTNISPRHALAVDPETLSPDARAYLGVAGAWFRSEGGYILEQSTRPRTLLVGLGDSPAGLAAWIIEKLRAWTDDVDAAFSPDELLTWVTAYWFTGAIGTSLSTYVEPASFPERTNVPTVVSTFAADTKPAPRAYVEAFVDLREFRAHDSGGHFAAWEQPEEFVTDLRCALALA